MRSSRVAFGLLVGALFVACSEDTPVAPPTYGPQLAAIGSEHGTWVQRFVAEDNSCSFWDAEGNTIFPVPCTYIHTPNPQALYTFRAWSDDLIPNPTGKAAHFGPENPPQELLDWYLDGFGIVPTAEGLLPLCDFNLHEYPEAWTVFPFPEEVLPLLICSTNWHYTISASGKGMLVWIADPEHSWRPYAE